MRRGNETQTRHATDTAGTSKLIEGRTGDWEIVMWPETKMASKAKLFCGLTKPAFQVADVSGTVGRVYGASRKMVVGQYRFANR